MYVIDCHDAGAGDVVLPLLQRRASKELVFSNFLQGTCSTHIPHTGLKPVLLTRGEQSVRHLVMGGALLHHVASSLSNRPPSSLHMRWQTIPSLDIVICYRAMPSC